MLICLNLSIDPLFLFQENIVNIYTFAMVCFGAAGVSLAMTPLVARIARSAGLLDKPGVRKVHKAPIPRIGGVAIFLATLAAILPAMAMDGVIGGAFHGIRVQIVTLLCAAAFVFLVAFRDDVRPLSAKIKLLCLVAASLAMCASGARINGFAVDGLFSVDLGWGSWPLTVLWIVGVTVGMNFIDGLDGLAAGIAAIVCGTIAVLAIYTGQAAMAIMMLALIGSLMGFLFFNFNPARIFMGDCGSMFLGFVIGAGSVVCSAKSPTVVGLALPMLALGVPILDAVLTVIRRGVLDRRSIFSAERGHIHHRLLAKGFSHRSAVLVIYAATLVAAGFGMLLLVTRSTGTLVVMGAALAFLLMLFRWVGSTRIAETLAAMQRNARIRQMAKAERGRFEHAQLAMREATSLDGWWNVVCGLADGMDFERIAVARNVGRGACCRVWEKTPAEPSLDEAVSITIPLRGGPYGFSQIEGTLAVSDSYETMGRRLMLFARLIDESELAKAPALALATPSRQRMPRPALRRVRDKEPNLSPALVASEALSD